MCKREKKDKRIKKERHHKYLEKQTTNKDIRLELINDVCIHTGLTKAALKRMIGTLNIRRLIQVKNDIHSFQPWFLNRIKRPKHGINSQNS